MELLGTIHRVQVQREALKGTGVYDPAPLLAGDEAALGPHGFALRHDGGWLLDVHHVAHPRVRGRGRRAFSIGFTSHYAAMAERFGATVTPGVAGENVIVTTDRVVGEADLAPGLVIRTADGFDVEVSGLEVAAPCVEFTSYLLGLDPPAPRQQLLDDLAFLHEGTRGFVAAVDHLAGPVILRPGDEVYLAG